MMNDRERPQPNAENAAVDEYEDELEEIVRHSLEVRERRLQEEEGSIPSTALPSLPGIVRGGFRESFPFAGDLSADHLLDPESYDAHPGDETERGEIQSKE